MQTSLSSFFKVKESNASSSSSEAANSQKPSIVEESFSDLGDKDFGPKQPKIDNFTFTDFEQRRLSFCAAWYENEKYNWLEYSVSSDAAFCFPCRNF